MLTFWELFTLKYSPYAFYLEPIYFIFLAMAPIIFLSIKSYGWFVIQVIVNVAYSVYLFVLSWNLTLSGAKWNTVFFAIILLMYLYAVIRAVIALGRFIRKLSNSNSF